MRAGIYFSRRDPYRHLRRETAPPTRWCTCGWCGTAQPGDPRTEQGAHRCPQCGAVTNGVTR